jgi:dienelactone hydrolase
VVTNLFQRLAMRGVDAYRRAIDPANKIGGTPAEKKDIYKERSPIYGIDKLQAPLLVHVTRNDTDVTIEESMQLIDALRARRPSTSETKIYDAPAGGHMFDRQSPATSRESRPAGAPPIDRMDPASYAPTNTPEQRDSWNRVWTFLEWHLQPYR